MIRGRICHPNKPDTFNQLWTVEEQVGVAMYLMRMASFIKHITKRVQGDDICLLFLRYTFIFSRMISINITRNFPTSKTISSL